MARARKTTPDPPDPALEKLRASIDAIDRKLLDLLARRGTFVQKVGRHKRKHAITFHRPSREREVLAAVAARNPGPYPDEAVEAIFREIMSASLALESPLTVAVCDEIARGAARRRFGSAARLRDEVGPAEVVDAVTRGWAAYGVVAVEDSATGFRGAALDALADADLPVTGEVVAHVEGVVTRSLVVGGEEPAPTGDDQTTAVLVPRDEPDALATMLATFGRRGVNIRRIEARPLRAARSKRSGRSVWPYQFFVDLEGHRADAPLGKALGDFARGSALIRVLGSYPRGRGR